MKEKFAAIVGEQHVSDAAADLFAYTRDGSGFEAKPRLVLWPSTAEEVAKIMKLANVRNMPVVARGGGTTRAGCTMAENALVLDLSRMNRVTRVHLTERSVTVQPATTVHQVNTLLASYDLHFPIIPHASRVSTLGGSVARNLACPYARFGKAGDWVMSMEVVDGTGKIFTPSRLPLFIGSEGILGIITEMTLKLVKPITAVSASWKAVAPDELMHLLASLDDDVLAIEYFDAFCSQLLGLGDKPHVWVEYVFLDKGDLKEPREVALHKERVMKLPALLKQRKFTVHTDPRIPREGLHEFLRFCRKHELPVYGHLGSGIMHACVRKERPEPAQWIYKHAQKLGGGPSGETGIGRAWKAYLSEQRQKELRQNKKFYDPSNIINPGCLV